MPNPQSALSNPQSKIDNRKSAMDTALFHRDLSKKYSVMVRGEGIYLYDEDGKRYIDGGAGAGNVTLGHGRRRIAEVMADQAETMAFCFSTSFTNKLALEFAARIADLAPGDLNHVYFVSGGSEGNESAFKICRQYHLQRGNSQKHIIISRWRAYHGATLGAMAVTGMPLLKNDFSPWFPNFPKITPCYPYRCALAGCEGQCNLSCAHQLEQAIIEAGPENVAAFIAEPVNSAGIAAGLPSDNYLKEIREICDKYEVLFIADEVITGFGRTGKYFAVEHWDVVPDMIVFGKGASSGYSPLGGVLMRDKIYNSFKESGQAFSHVFTYVDNPVAMRVGLEVLAIIEEEKILDKVAEKEKYFFEKTETLKKHSMVGDIRGKGLLWGIELVKDRETKEPFPAQLKVGQQIADYAFKKGLSMGAGQGSFDWINGDDIRLSPPLIISHEQIDEIIQIIDEGMSQVKL